MSQTTLATLSAALVFVALIAYAVLGGADFGGGIWDLLARGPTTDRDRAAIARGMGPVWESNNIWLIFVLVVTWTAFPIVFAGVSTALFIPITLALIGIVLRGASFSFRSHYGLEIGAGVRWGYVFGVASVITPFFLGTVAGALASGDIRVSGQPAQVNANIWTTWTTPFALSCGAFALGLCSVVSATYLAVDAKNSRDESLALDFRRRALVAGAVTSVLGALAAVLAISEAPTLWQGLTGRALPFSIGAVVLGLATAAALLRNAYLVARVLVAAETACILVAWGVAQWPYLIVPDVTIDNAASPASVLGAMLVVAVIGLIIVLPALWYLFSVFKRRETTRGPVAGSQATVASFVASFEPAPAPTLPSNRSETSSPRGTLFKRLEPMLVFLLVVMFASVATGVSGGMRQGFERYRSRPRKLAKQHRPQPIAG